VKKPTYKPEEKIMSDYCLTINVRSKNEALLNNLIVTLETINDDFSGIDGVEMVTETTAEKIVSDMSRGSDKRDINKAVYLECWMINEETMESL
jgi:hypothetical protein